MCYLMVLISFVQCDVVFLVLLILSRFNIFHRPAFSRLLVFIIGLLIAIFIFFFFQAEDGIRDWSVTGVQTCALPIWPTGFRLFIVARTPLGLPERSSNTVCPGPSGWPSPNSTTSGPCRSGRRILTASRSACARVSAPRSEERRVGKEGRPRGARGQ